jgi:ATP-dependent helicase HepA
VFGGGVRPPDATPLLAALSVESRRFYDGRSRFVHAYLQRAAAYQRITALSSASIELHPHQVEAARRVLSDVTQRYLLADEVGLGKTIEAGILIRQHLLDNAPGSVLVAVPPALTSQWRRELAEKLRLEEQFPGQVDIVAFDELASLNETSGIGLLVVDEAHRIAAEASVDDLAQRLFDSLAAVAYGVAKVILLSATPLLQEPASLLRLLHLLSPNSYRLDDLPAFEAMLQSRDEIGTLYANLDAEQERRKVVAERTVRRQAEHQAGRVFAGEGRERCGDPRRDQAGRRCREKHRTSPQNEALTAGGADTGNA